MNPNTTPEREDAPRAQKASPRRLIDAGNLAILTAILLSVAPGVDASATAIQAIGLVGGVLILVDVLGALYDLATGVLAEVRA